MLEPILVRAHGKPDGCITELVLRFEPALGGTSASSLALQRQTHVLHVDCQMVVTNRLVYVLTIIIMGFCVVTEQLSSMLWCKCAKLVCTPHICTANMCPVYGCGNIM